MIIMVKKSTSPNKYLEPGRRNWLLHTEYPVNFAKDYLKAN